MHSLAGSQEVHILRVTDESVQIQSHPLDKVARPLSYAGPPPPSPPASLEKAEDDEDTNQRIFAPRLTMPTQSEPPVIYDEPASIIDEPSSPVPPITLHPASPDPHMDPYALRMSAPPPTAPLSSFPSSLKPEGHLQPPPLTGHRPTRRNTTGSALPKQVQRPLHSFTQQPFALDDTVIVGDAALALASDIEIHSERIRRERQSKRAKQLQQAEAEAALTRTDTRGTRGTRDEDDKPLVGNLIGEDHANYVLMYNMLTGIRIGVSRCQAKIKRPLTDEDFTARHKFSFDIIGNELTPSAKYDFKFKDYAPWVFRTLREDFFRIDPADYLLSLTAKYILSELGSPGKSGSFFYFSRDYRFIIKTIRHSEHKFLLKTLRTYYEHVKNNPHTLLSRFYGLHRVKLPRGKKIHFVIMNNLFPPHKDIHETYDLKGSTVGREYPEEKARKNPRAVLKDLNWINRGKQLELGPEKRALLTEQLRRDTEYLKSVDVMDYSLLVGTHNMQRGNRDNVRKNTLKVFTLPQQPRKKQPTRGIKTPEAIAMRRAVRSSDPKALTDVASIAAMNASLSGSSPPGPSSAMTSGAVPSTPGPSTSMLPHPGVGMSSTASSHVNQSLDARAATPTAMTSDATAFDDNVALFLDEDTTVDRQYFIFYQDEGGLQATDEENKGIETIYYLGVIDILTPYGIVKRAEHWWKTLLAVRGDRRKISQVPPAEYGNRFFAFMKAIMKGGTGAEDFK